MLSGLMMSRKETNMKAIFTILMLAGWLLALHALRVWGNPEVSA
jgi:hypothetical protein